MSHVGPIKSPVPGRTDRHQMQVPSGSFVFPADFVSALGENNTDAGMAVLGGMFGPQGPYAEAASGFARGGPVGDLVDVVTAGGEFVLEPSLVRAIGGGDMQRGHDILDSWVLRMRKDHIKTLKGLPKPARD